MKTELTVDKLRELLSYSPETGEFRWRDCDQVYCNVRGKSAGCMTDRGYLIFSFNGKTHYAHRLAWLYVHGAMPKHQIDHINGIRHDNRIANLRDVTPQVNAQNIRPNSKFNKYGLLGVSLTHYGRFTSEIRAQGRKIRLGVFDTPTEANAAYLAAKRRLHEGCTL